MVLVVGQNSAIQKTFSIDRLVPGAVNRIAAVHVSSGGKGANTARALVQLRMPTLVLAYVGGLFGRKYIEMVEADGIRHEVVWIKKETRGCTTILERKQGTTELAEPAPAVSEAERVRFNRLFSAHIHRAQLLIIAGTAVIGERQDCYQRYILEAKQHGVAVLLDSYRRHGRLALEASPEILKINRDELEELARQEFGDFVSEEEGALSIMASHAIRWIIVTKGAQGATGYGDGQIVSARPPPTEAVNSIGSGDAFCAGVTWGLMKDILAEGSVDESQWSLKNALSAGVAAGSANSLTVIPGHLEPEAFHEMLKSISLSARPQTRSL